MTDTLMQCIFCYKCRVMKPITEFAHNRSRYTGYSNCCKPCQKVVLKEWRLRDPEKVKCLDRARHSKHCYGPMAAEYRQQQLKKQQGRCAICQVEELTLKKHLTQDHAHKCCPGRVTCGKCLRGLLCDPCNRKLQVWVEDLLLLLPTEVLEKTKDTWVTRAHSYLTNWGSKWTN